MDSRYWDEEPVAIESKADVMTSSKERFEDRAARWRALGLIEPIILGAELKRKRPVGFALARHHAWWLVHNLVSHPMIGILPVKATFRFHDWTSYRLNGLHHLEKPRQP